MAPVTRADDCLAGVEAGKLEALEHARMNARYVRRGAGVS
jgi:hypothetical protein